MFPNLSESICAHTYVTVGIFALEVSHIATSDGQELGVCSQCLSTMVHRSVGRPGMRVLSPAEYAHLPITAKQGLLQIRASLRLIGGC